MLLLTHDAPTLAPSLAAASSLQADRCRVLVVDDDEPTAIALARLMGLLGHEAHIAADGRAALEIIASYEPDLVLLDLGLPTMDGCAVARQIRADWRVRDVTLVALTGYGGDEDRARVRDAGFDYHLVKPVTMRTLEALLASTRRASPGPAARPAPIGQ